MKRLLAIAFLLASCGNNNSKQATTSTKPVVKSVEDPIIGTSKKLGAIEIAARDFPDMMIWDQAKAACEGLGSGWRLPSKGELENIYLNKDSLGGFTTDLYWNAAEPDSMNAGTQNFFNGKQGRFSKIYSCRVRAVRSF